MEEVIKQVNQYLQYQLNEEGQGFAINLTFLSDKNIFTYHYPTKVNIVPSTNNSKLKMITIYQNDNKIGSMLLPKEKELKLNFHEEAKMLVVS